MNRLSRLPRAPVTEFLVFAMSLCALVSGCSTSSGSSATSEAGDIAGSNDTQTAGPNEDSQVTAPDEDTGQPITTEHNPGEITCHDHTTGKAGSRDIVEWTSTDGTTFTQRRLFQYCADVPSLAQNPDGTILAAFQGWVDKEEDARWD